MPWTSGSMATCGTLSAVKDLIICKLQQISVQKILCEVPQVSPQDGRLNVVLFGEQRGGSGQVTVFDDRFPHVGGYPGKGEAVSRVDVADHDTLFELAEQHVTGGA